jgi:hypothetical protein
VGVVGLVRPANGKSFIAPIRRKHWEPLLTDERAILHFTSIRKAALADMKNEAHEAARKIIEELQLQDVFDQLLSEPPLVDPPDPDPGNPQSDPGPL